MDETLQYVTDLEQIRSLPQRDDHGDPEELLAKLDEAEQQIVTLRDQLKAVLEQALLR